MGIIAKQSDQAELRRTVPKRLLRWIGLAIVVAAFLFGLLLVGGGLLVWMGVLPDYTGPDNKSLTSADIASAIVAGATGLLAGITGLLAIFAWDSALMTRQEVVNTEQAVKAAQRQAKIAEESIIAGWRPLLTEVPVGARLNADVERYVKVTIKPTVSQEFSFDVGFMNFGRGPAFLIAAELPFGDTSRSTTMVQPKIVPEGALLVVTFALDPTFLGGEDRKIAESLVRGGSLDVAVTYHELGRQRAWRSFGLLEMASPGEWFVRYLQVSEAKLTDNGFRW